MSSGSWTEDCEHCGSLQSVTCHSDNKNPEGNYTTCLKCGFYTRTIIKSGFLSKKDLKAEQENYNPGENDGK